MKQNDRKQKIENIRGEDIDLGRLFELATTNKLYARRLNLHEIKSENLQDFTGDFELIGSVLIGEIEQKTNRFKIVDDFETHINAIENGGYDSEDVSSIGWLYKLNTTDFNKVNRSHFVRRRDFNQDIVEYLGNNRFIPTSGNRFIKYINRLTGKDFTEILNLVRTEQRRSNVMTSARIEPFCRKHIFNIGYFNGEEVWPGSITESKIAIKMHENNFC